MDKATVKQIQTEVSAFIKEKFPNYDLLRNNASYTTDDCRLTITLSEKVEVIQQRIGTKEERVVSPDLKQNLVDSGLAQRGAVLLHTGPGGRAPREVTILASRRTKYLFTFNDDPQSKKWVAPFHAFKVKPEVANG